MEKKNSIAIITSGYFPVPAAMGGAVEALDENLIRQNEIEKKVHFVVFSCHNDKAKKDSEKYQNSSFIFIRTPKIISFADKLIYWIAKNILKKKKSMSYRYILQRLHYINIVAKHLKEKDFDKIVVENHSTLFMALKKYNNYEKYAGRFYYHLHNIVTNDYGCDKLIASCKKVIGVSNYINGTLQEFLGKKDQNTYCVLKNKIDNEKFKLTLSAEKKISTREEFGLHSDDVVILFSGRFNQEKGIKELLEAFKQIKNKKAKLLVVGGYYFGSGMVSTFEEKMHTLASDINEQVIFTGFIPYEKMPEVYAIADIVVIPSIWDDPAPLTVIESLTSGKPLITTYSGGISEYADEETSILIKRDEYLVANLVKSLQKLINDEKLRYKMEQATRQKTKNWTLKSYYDEFCDIIDVE